MEDLIRLAVGGIRPPWSYVLGTLALLVALGPRITALYQEWLDFRVGKRNLELEKQQLEVLKLRYEIESMRQAHPLPAGAAAVPASPAPVRISLQSRPTPAPAVVERLARGSPVGKALLFGVQMVIGGVGSLLALTTVVTPIILVTDQEFRTSIGIGMGAVVVLFYGLLTWGMWVAYKTVRQWRTA